MSLATAATGIKQSQSTSSYAEEKQALIKKWQDSQLSKAEFCRRENIKESQFYNWTRPERMGQAKPVQNKNVLLPARVVPQGKTTGRSNAPSRAADVTGTKQIMITLVSGVKITLPLPSNLQEIASLVKELTCNSL